MGLTPDGRHLTLTYDEVKQAWDLEYTVEVSSDLVEWSSGDAFVEITAIEDRGATRRVTARDLARLDENPRHFIRLKVRVDNTEVIVP